MMSFGLRLCDADGGVRFDVSVGGGGSVWL